MRSTVDKLVSWLGLALAILLAVVAALAFWGSSFIKGQVADQLSAQKITMPSGKAIENPEIKPYLEKYAGQPMTTGDQAQAFAEHYVAVHMKEIADGKTFNEVSGQVQQMQNDPNADQAQLTKLRAQSQSLFQGNALRGMLLNAYAFGTIGKIAGYAAWAATIGAVVMLLLSLLGLNHAKKAATAEAGYAGTPHGATRA